ncbi:MAG: MerR family transcriptional regulator [Beijerinckiaceae bacterium]|nr:MerR family transcriptional regulator [Beijerinckiaceae bacterium]
MLCSNLERFGETGLAMGTNPRSEGANGLYIAGNSVGGGEEWKRPALPEARPRPRLYSIREMAWEFQITVRTLRFYEQRGLLRPGREGGVRLYDERDRLHLKMILKGKELGFTLAEIQAILAAQDANSGREEIEMALSPGMIAAQIAHLEEQRGKIERAIAALREAERRLRDSLAGSGDGAGSSGG